MTSTSNAQDDVIGKAIITDGDTIKINNQSIRLNGLDAPEKKQDCYLNFKSYDCGQMSKTFLKNFVGNRNLTCHITGTDKYRRLLGTCFMGQYEINREIVVAGYAVSAYGTDYLDEELYAMQNNIGVWQYRMMDPAKWRKMN